jgi:hypothetical protein
VGKRRRKKKEERGKRKKKDWISPLLPDPILKAAGESWLLVYKPPGIC